MSIDIYNFAIIGVEITSEEFDKYLDDLLNGFSFIEANDTIYIGNVLYHYNIARLEYDEFSDDSYSIEQLCKMKDDISRKLISLGIYREVKHYSGIYCPY